MDVHTEIYVILGNRDKARQFVDICNKYEGDINIYQKSTILDGKSSVGILALALNEEICVEYLGGVEDGLDFYQKVRELLNIEEDNDEENAE